MLGDRRGWGRDKLPSLDLRGFIALESIDRGLFGFFWRLEQIPIKPERQQRFATASQILGDFQSPSATIDHPERKSRSAFQRGLDKKVKFCYHKDNGVLWKKWEW